MPENKKYDNWRKRAVKRLPEIANRVFNLRNKLYMGCGFHWSLEKGLGRSIYDLQNCDVYPDEITKMTIQIGFESLIKDITKIEKELKNNNAMKNININNVSEQEIQDFKKDWGQSQSEITSNLGYSRKHSESDELLIADGYFWIEADKKWYNKHASMFTEREQVIADYLYSLSTYQYLNE